MRQDLENQRLTGWESRLKEKETYLKRKKEDIGQEREDPKDEALKIREKESREKNLSIR